MLHDTEHDLLAIAVFYIDNSGKRRQLLTIRLLLHATINCKYS